MPEETGEDPCAMPQVRTNLQNHFLQQVGWELCPFINLPVRGLPYPIDPSFRFGSVLRIVAEHLLGTHNARVGRARSVENRAANTHVCMIDSACVKMENSAQFI